MKAKQAAVVVGIAALVLTGCNGPGAGATFDPDAPGAEPAPADDDEPDEVSRPVVKGREDPSTGQEADLDQATERACGRAVTGSGRYSQAGYDRGVTEGVEAGLDEDELVAAIEERCGDAIREAQGDG